MKIVALPWLAASFLTQSALAQAPPQSPVPIPPTPSSLVAGKQAPKVEDIWVVFKTHCDLGFTMSAAAVNEKYRGPMMDHAIQLIEADRAKPAAERFKWTIAGWPMAANILGPQQEPQRKLKIEQALREGSINVHALPATLHTDAFELEDYVRALEPALEVLDTELRGWGLTPPSVAGPLAAAYENSLLYGEHTWGANTPGWGFFSHDGSNRGTERYLYGDQFRLARTQGYYKKFEASFDDHRAYIRTTEAIVNRELQGRLDLLAKSVKHDGRRIVVWNALPWPRSGYVGIPGQPGQFIQAADVPANGYRTFELPAPATPAKPSLANNTLETPVYKAVFDLDRGGISSLIEKSTGRELVDRSSPYVLGQYLHERFSEAQTWDYYHRFCVMNNAAWGTVKPNMPKDARYTAITPHGWNLTASQDTAGATTVTLTATDTAGLANGITTVFTFPADKPCVDTEWRITGKAPDAIPEGGWLCFPFAVPQARFLVGRLGGPINLVSDQIIGGNRHLYGVNTGAAIVAPDHAGVGLCALDSPCLSFGEPGLWKYTFDYLPKQPAVFVNLYNNMWNCNFPDWIEGTWSNRVRLWPIAKDGNPAANLAIQSWEARLPLLAAVADGPAGMLPTEQHGLTLSRPGTLITAYGQNPDGPGTVLRLWEQAGQRGILTVSFPAGAKFTTATPVNLRGETVGGPLPITGGKIIFSLDRYTPASFILN